MNFLNSALDRLYSSASPILILILCIVDGIRIVEGGKRCSDRDFEPMANPRECRSVARDLGIPVKRPMKIRNLYAPRGCSIVTTQIGRSFQKTVRFNNIQAAYSIGNFGFRPICTI